MIKRWNLSNRYLPEPDLKDIEDESYHSTGKVIGLYKKHSHFPEHTQSSYLRLLCDEEVFNISNYFETKQNLKMNQYEIPTYQ
jgi:hypothetical protein